MATVHGPNLDVTIEFATLGDLAEFDGLELYVRVHQTEISGDQSFYLRISNDTATTLDFFGSGTGAGAFWGQQNSVTITAGDAVGMRADGDTMSAWHRTGGVWTMLFSGTPTSFSGRPYLREAGFVGVYFGSYFNPGAFTAPSFDNYTIAEWSGAAPAFPAPTSYTESFSGSGTLGTGGRWETWFNLNGGGCGNDEMTYQGGQAVNTGVYPCGFNAYFHVAYSTPVVFNDPPVTPPPERPDAPCTPRSTVSNGGRGRSGCNTGGVGWTTDYDGALGYGVVPQHADPVDGELLDGQPTVDLWLQLDHRDRQTDDIVTYRRAHIELGHAGTYEGGLKSEGLGTVGDIQHAVSNEQGGFEAATVDIVYHDRVDRLLRETLGDEDLEGDEIAIKLVTPQGAAASVDPRVALRAIVQQPASHASPVQSTITAVDALFADHGPLGPQRLWPPKVPAGAFPSAPPDTLEMALPWLYGEKSDQGAVDPITGDPIEKGLCPLLYAGPRSLGSVTSIVNLPTTEGAIGSATFGRLGGPGNGWIDDGSAGPVFVIGAVVGTTVRFFVNTGEVTLESTQVVHGWRIVWNDPGLSADYYIAFLLPPGFASWGPFSNPAPSGTSIRYQTVPAAASNPFPDWQFVVYWATPTDGNAWPHVSTPTDNVWDEYIAFGHPVFRIIDLFASDLGHGNPDATRDRERINLATRNGVDVLVPGYAGWPFTETFREYTDTDGTVYWVTSIFMRGPVSEDHKNGVVTAAVNAIGRDDSGDGLGLPLIDAEPCKQSWIENEILSYWTSGPLADDLVFPQYQDGTPKVRSSSFEQRRQYQINTFGSRGLTVGWYVDKQASLSEHVREWNLLESLVGINGHGQVISFGLDEFANPLDWSRIEHESDVFGPVTRTSGIQRENVLTGTCDWDPDYEKFREPDQTVTSAEGIIRNKHRRRLGTPVQSKILNVPAQLLWVLQKRRLRLEFGMSVVDVTGTLGFLDHDVGQGRRLTSIEGLGVGYNQRPMLIRRRLVQLSTQPTRCLYTLWDVSEQIYAATLPGGDVQLPLVIDTGGGQAMLVTDDPDLAPAVLV